MIKSELIDRIAKLNPHLYRRDLENIVNTVLGEITKSLRRGDRVELRGFGVFQVKQRDGRVGRNPRNGNEVYVAAKAVPAFRTGKDMHQRLNPGDQSEPQQDAPTAAPTALSP